MKDRRKTRDCNEHNNGRILRDFTVDSTIGWNTIENLCGGSDKISHCSIVSTWSTVVEVLTNAGSTATVGNKFVCSSTAQCCIAVDLGLESSKDED